MLFKFKISGAGELYTVWVCDDDESQAVRQAQTIAGEGRRIELMEEREGTYDDLLRPGFHHLVERRHEGMHKKKWGGGNARKNT